MLQLRQQGKPRLDPTRSSCDSARIGQSDANLERGRTPTFFLVACLPAEMSKAKAFYDVYVSLVEEVVKDLREAIAGEEVQTSVLNKMGRIIDSKVCVYLSRVLYGGKAGPG